MLRQEAVEQEAVEVAEPRACASRRPCPASRSVIRPVRKRVVIGGVYYPPFLRQYHSRSEGAFDFAIRLAQNASVQEVSEYSWLCLMGRTPEAAVELERVLKTLTAEQRRELPSWSQEICKRVQSQSGRGVTELLDERLIAALRERLRR